MIDSFRSYKTTKSHPHGVGWVLHIIDGNANVKIQKLWFKDLMTLFSFVLSYPENTDQKGLRWL